jgi:hypothetical protein
MKTNNTVHWESVYVLCNYINTPFLLVLAWAFCRFFWRGSLLGGAPESASVFARTAAAVHSQGAIAACESQGFGWNLASRALDYSKYQIPKKFARDCYANGMAVLKRR